MPRAPWLPRSGQCRRDDTRVVHDTVSAFVHSPFGAPRLPGGFWGANRGGTAAAVGAWLRRWVGAAAGAWSHSGALRGRSCATLGSEQCVLLWDRLKPSCSRAGTAAATGCSNSTPRWKRAAGLWIAAHFLYLPRSEP